jgi:hypothetical protein
MTNYEIANRIAILHGRTLRSIARSGAKHIIIDLGDFSEDVGDHIEDMSVAAGNRLMNLAWDIANNKK